MKKLTLPLAVVLLLFLLGCGGGQSRIDKIKAASTKEKSDPSDDWETNPGIGPIEAFTLPSVIDEELALKGQEIYEAMCTACHKAEKRFIGPSPKGILEKRSPAWVMNMILNPDEMVQKDPLARQLLIEFNGSPMANQNLSEEEARAVLEYFRTL